MKVRFIAAWHRLRQPAERRQMKTGKAKRIRARRMWRDLDWSIHATKAKEGKCVPVGILDLSDPEALVEQTISALEQQWNRVAPELKGTWEKKLIEPYARAVLACLGLVKRGRK